MADGYDELTDKEKETLRLMVRGHDAKSAASELSLSVHTINERLRAARRKLEVTSSREAARLVLEREGDDPQNPVSKDLGDAPGKRPGDDRAVTAGYSVRRPIIAGVLVMLTLAAAALFLVPSIVQSDNAGGTVQAPSSDAEVERAARAWLKAGDAGDWQAAFDAAGKPFRDVNTVAGFAEASQKVRVPLGAVISRTLATVRYLNAPPHGYEEVTFHTRFANKPDAVETVTLEKENGQWKVVGILID
jgi:DNA-binding CsgD family transcriptional regulator